MVAVGYPRLRGQKPAKLDTETLQTKFGIKCCHEIKFMSCWNLITNMRLFAIADDDVYHGETTVKVVEISPTFTLHLAWRGRYCQPRTKRCVHHEMPSYYSYVHRSISYLYVSTTLYTKNTQCIYFTLYTQVPVESSHSFPKSQLCDEWIVQLSITCIINTYWRRHSKKKVTKVM